MKLKALIRGLEGLEVRGSKEIELTGLSVDSRTVAPGFLFLAKKGSSLDGAQFIPQALNAGAVAIVTDLYDPSIPVTQVIAKDPGAWEAKLASRFYGVPSKELFVVGTTGTKGKTTSSYMIWHLLRGLGKKAGLISTVETILGEERRNSTLTTHGAIHNQKLLREMRSRGVEAVSLEVSSHGLHQGRVDEVEFDVGLFTNLHPDHLDYHKTVEEYAAAKRLLLRKPLSRALFNADNSWTSFMREGVSAPSWTFGIEKPADLRASDLRWDGNGTQFTAEFGGERASFHLKLMGRFNVYNALGATLVGLHLGAKLADIAAILSTFETAPGRLEQVPNERGIWVFVDYAHTGEALENVLKTLREIARKRVICLFGAGGNRDPARRVQMAKAVEAFADIPIVTSDNPRNESPETIVREILSGFSDPSKAIVELDRKVAIHRAIELAEPEDIVLIAGKGHEKIQIFAHQTIPFDDVAIAKEVLEKQTTI
ncbi:MAG: UDP-N-acetylmuramoyl-L-alanyl-D-glutamate--2,6-diaminopimelate ligase [Verrucomicrobiota bacterium]|nr:UDP-N-acetylmuramoyl-L-alanyl-D-glutamate--2,6-diaminopimelate ligase [Verrucomicrobiota bacterium]